MKTNKLKLLTSALALSMMASASLPVFAAGNGENVAVNIEAKATTVNITMSDTVPVTFNADGTNTVPTNFSIKNNSAISGLHLDTVKLTAAASTDWKVAADSFNTKTMAKDTKTIIFKLGAEGKLKTAVPASGTTAATGTATFGAADFQIPATGSKIMKFDITRGAFSKELTSAKAFDMVMNFSFD